MSSADLNNGSSDFRHPEKAESVDELTRVYGGLAPKIFFTQLLQDFRPIRSLQPDLERASFLYRRMRSYRLWLGGRSIRNGSPAGETTRVGCVWCTGGSRKKRADSRRALQRLMGNWSRL